MGSKVQQGRKTGRIKSTIRQLAELLHSDIINSLKMFGAIFFKPRIDTKAHELIQILLV
jgi:hypothetical protein